MALIIKGPKIRAKNKRLPWDLANVLKVILHCLYNIPVYCPSANAQKLLEAVMGGAKK
jgi:hypothetical protein